jgi:hypothetical protein
MTPPNQPCVIKVTARDQDGKVLYRAMIPAQISPHQTTIALEILDHHGRLLTSSTSDSGHVSATTSIPTMAQSPQAL